MSYGIMGFILGAATACPFFCPFPAVARVIPQDNDNTLLSQQQSLPSLGSASVNESGSEKKLATIARQMAEVNQDENNDQTWRSYLLGEAKDRVLNRLQQKSEAMLSPLGYTQVQLNVDESGRFSGSSGQMLLPLDDQKTRGLTYGQLGLQGVDDDIVGNMGLGQRWNAGRWLLGLNVFYDQYLQHNSLRRGSVGAEARSDYLSLSSNYYYPLSAMHALNDDDDERVHMASGYDITTQGYLPFYRQLGASVKYEQYFGQRVDVFDSGNYRANPAAVELGVSYTPVPLMTLSASHKLGDGTKARSSISSPSIIAWVFRYTGSCRRITWPRRTRCAAVAMTRCSAMPCRFWRLNSAKACRCSWRPRPGRYSRAPRWRLKCRCRRAIP